MPAPAGSQSFYIFTSIDSPQPKQPGFRLPSETRYEIDFESTNLHRSAWREEVQCDSPKELMSPPEKNVPMILPRVIGRSRCDGCDSSWCTVMRSGRGRRK